MNKQTLNYRGFTLCYTHKPRQKHTYISIEDNGVVSVRTPIDNMDTLYRIIQKKEQWILQRLNTILSYETIILGETLYYLGTLYAMDDNIAQPLKQAISRLRIAEPRTIQRCYDHFYKHACTCYLPQRIAHFSEQMGLYPSGVSYRKMKRRWGSCDATKALTFNSAVMRLSPRQIDYIIVHELAHIQHMNHSPDFHRLVETHLEGSRSIERELRRLRP